MTKVLTSEEKEALLKKHRPDLGISTGGSLHLPSSRKVEVNSHPPDPNPALDITSKGHTSNTSETGAAVNLNPSKTERSDPSKGEIGELTDEESSIFLKEGSEYKPLAFVDYVDMLGAFDKNIQDGIINWYPWQVEIGMFLSQKFTKQDRLRLLLVACNGSGKDAYVNAPFAVWHCLCKIRSRCVITSASYTQLKNQTENYIRSLCNKINTLCVEQGIYELPPFIIKKEHIICRYTHSEIIMFSTDDPGRAEGYHPFPDYPQGEVSIIINEAKTVPDTIFEALSRCTYTRWIEISSPGHTSGHLYRSYRQSVEWDKERPNFGYQRGRFFSRRVTAYDCPEHISKDLIESEKIELGENSALFRSKRLALFTSLDQQVVLTSEDVAKCLNNPPEPHSIKSFVRQFGLDIGKGNDENSLFGIEGNRLFCAEWFQAKDFYEQTAPVIDKLLKKHGCSKEDNINADDGGVGSGLIDILINQYGWKITRVLNQSKVIVKGQGYGNRGAENWFRAAQIIKGCLIDLTYLSEVDVEQKTLDQLSNRHYKQHESQGTIILKSKKEEKAEGIKSPDRADGLVLALAGLSIHDFTDDLDKPLRGIKKPGKRNMISPDEIHDYMDKRKYDKLEKDKPKKSRNPSRLLRQLVGL